MLNGLKYIAYLLLAVITLNLFSGPSHEFAHSMEAAVHSSSTGEVAQIVLDHSPSNASNHLADHHQDCAASANCCALVALSSFAAFNEPVQVKAMHSEKKLFSSYLLGLTRPPSA